MLIKNAKIYGNKPADVRIEKGLIAEIGANLTPKSEDKDEGVKFAPISAIKPFSIRTSAGLFP